MNKKNDENKNRINPKSYAPPVPTELDEGRRHRMVIERRYFDYVFFLGSRYTIKKMFIGVKLKEYKEDNDSIK